jgi:N-acetylglucosamine-6-phosphate deacetylase
MTDVPPAPNLRPGDPYAVTGTLALGDHSSPGAVVVANGRIAEVLLHPRSGNLPPTIYAAPIISPGLIDLQVNGGFGQEVGADPTALPHLAAHLPATGVTAFLPTLISSPDSAYPPLFAAIAASTNVPGAHPLGLHLEGPFLSPARKGAHPLAAIEAAMTTSSP